MKPSSESGVAEIRSFLYLDPEKLRSISSQLFKGVVTSVLRRESTEDGRSDQQSGPFASGQVLADIFSKRVESEESAFLEDHAYTLFEDELIKLDKIVDVCGAAVDDKMMINKFVRVTGRLAINDTRVISDLVGRYNQFGFDMTRVINDKSLTAKALGKPINKKEVQKLANETGMQLEADFSESLNRLIEYTSKGSFEFEIATSGMTFSAPSKRQFLRESEDMIIQKFSRYTQTKFSILGSVTQAGNGAVSADTPEDVKDAPNLRNALRGMSGHIRALEDSFGSLQDGEIVLDPIAVYQFIG